MILHLDMDAFFASVEQMDHPELRGQPVIVGGGDRGVVSTASYEARVFGIHSAMPMSQARKLCPQGNFIHGNYHRYVEVSRKIMEALQAFSPVVQPASIDEAYLDLEGTRRLFGTPQEAGYAIKKCVRHVTGGLTCSVGIAPVKFLAKICSDMDKPDGLFYLPPEKVDEFLLSLDVAILPGVGKKMAQSLSSFGITKVEHLRHLSRQFMAEKYGKWGITLHERAFGIDPRPVHLAEPPKSESSEHTLERDTRDKNLLREMLLLQSDRVSASLRKRGLAGRVITLKIKFEDFRQITRSRTIEKRTSSAPVIYAVATDLLDAVSLAKAVRLVGVGVSGFEARHEYLELPGIAKNDPADGDKARRQRKLEGAVDNLRERFGANIIHPATTLPDYS